MTMTPTASSLSSYTLFCGVLVLDPGQVIKPNSTVVPWTNRLNNSATFLQYLNKSYYRNFLNNMVPESSSSGNCQHFTLSVFSDLSQEAALPHQDKSLRFTIPYLDIYLFPDDVLIFAFRATLAHADTTYANISHLIRHMRHPGSTFTLGGDQVTVKEFVQRSLSAVIQLREDWDQYTPQLKTYTVANDSSVTQFNEELNQVLYELSHVIPIGNSRESELAPNSRYLHEVLDNSISVYNNWKAITLFDTFTRISCSFPDPFQSWEQEYFLIYVHALYTKYQLYSFNSQLNDSAAMSRLTKQLRSRFISFVNNYHLAYISYKFLPNLIYERMSHSVEIQKELDRMEIKLNRLHQAYEERKSHHINQLLLVLSLLSLLSVVTDLSAWLTEMGAPREVVYSPLVPFGLFGGFLLAGYLIYKRKAR